MSVWIAPPRANDQEVRIVHPCRRCVRIRNTLCEQMFSASPPNSDIPRCGWHFAFVPATDSFTAANRVVNRSLRRRARAPAGRAVLHLGFPAGWVRAAGEGERHEDLQEQLKPPSGGVFLGLNGIVIKSYRKQLQELHSKIKQTVASAVRRRGHKRRTLWRGVTTRPGQPWSARQREA